MVAGPCKQRCGGSSARRTAGPVGGQFLSRGRTTSHAISPTRTRNSMPIPSHPSEPIPFPKPPIMVNSSFFYPLRPGHVQCRALVPCSRRGTVAHRLPIPYGRPSSQPVSSERTQFVELRALGSTGSSAEGAIVDRPEPDELADFGSAVIPGRRTSRPRGLFVVDGGSQCPGGPSCAAGFAISCWEVGCSSVRRSWPRLSFLFPRVPFCSLEASVATPGRWDAACREQHSRRSATCGNGRGDRI
jgi:hypothetical protein